ncbi:MAG TPA: hypothetical protein VF177_19935, partial [Anaerolineae bacterium]
MKVYSLALFTALAIFAILGASTIAADVPALFVESASETNAEAAATSVTQEWVTQYPGLRGVGIAVDAGDFIYVTGPSPNDASRNYRRNIVTVKYDQAGNQVWAREFDETDDATYGEDISNWLTLDPYGNVIVTGRSFINSTGDDFITLKYDPDGNLL